MMVLIWFYRPLVNHIHTLMKVLWQHNSVMKTYKKDSNSGSDTQSHCAKPCPVCMHECRCDSATMSVLTIWLVLAVKALQGRDEESTQVKQSATLFSVTLFSIEAALIK